ncbi:limulus clotting factor C-like isoform X2 [Acyrthosiphon pisum]|uniref:Peptidase S1 domain-containing protein n=1 Tax=Acyrthosiphon pisum TaxID=7029 RepID=A0A8R2H4S8_ACYPI|nr:limulus clotting factor C-like isoform X2 [Acyrthosiphon pisum]|eukprot:XP_016655839.1 PREDICTED: limulus clotting factor C-like isoform X2 [Acyrthosiphon pisum]
MDDPKDGIFSGFADLKYYVQWIRGILNKHFIENSCFLPIVEGILYSYEGSNEILSHGTLINHHRTIIEKCELGYHMAYPIGIRFCQGKGKWLSNTEKLCFNCGRVYVKNHVLIDNGDKALVGTAPWNVGIYQLNKTDSNYDMICGGSIISPNLIISAAHCFWKKAMLSKKISITDDLYKIAVGKYDRNFTIIDNEFTQIINVETIHLKEGYYGPTGFHAEDIAIIVLQNLVSFSNGVSPICIDWNGKYNVANGDQGKIVGWGKTEKGISSPILLEASLPYIDHSTCRNMFINGFELFVTVDKFCAGSSLGNQIFNRRQ